MQGAECLERLQHHEIQRPLQHAGLGRRLSIRHTNGVSRRRGGGQMCVGRKNKERRTKNQERNREHRTKNGTKNKDPSIGSSIHRFSTFCFLRSSLRFWFFVAFLVLRSSFGSSFDVLCSLFPTIIFPCPPRPP